MHSSSAVRRVVLVAAALLGVAAVRVAAFCWYASGRVYAQAFRASSGPPAGSMTVLASDGGSVVLRHDGAGSARRPGVWGLEWREHGGGYLQLGEVAGAGGPGRAVRRPLLGPPAATPPAGVRARLDSFASADDPAARAPVSRGAVRRARRTDAGLARRRPLRDAGGVRARQGRQPSRGAAAAAHHRGARAAGARDHLPQRRRRAGRRLRALRLRGGRVARPRGSGARRPRRGRPQSRAGRLQHGRRDRAELPRAL
jgi:hypothetical protein